MTATISVTDSPPSARITFASGDLSGDVNTITVFRTADGRTTQLRTATDLLAIGGVSVFDAEMPPGVPVTYRAQQFDADGSDLGFTDSVIGTSAAPPPWIGWLSDPLDEKSALQIILTDTAGTAPQRNIPGTVYPVGAQAFVLTGVQGPLTDLDMGFYTSSDNDDAAVLALLAQSTGIVLIRTGPDFGLLVPRALYCFAGTAAPQFIGRGGSLWANTVSETTPTVQPVQQSNASYDDVDAAFATYTLLDAAFASYLELEAAFDDA